MSSSSYVLDVESGSTTDINSVMFCVDVTSFVLLLDLVVGDGLTVPEPYDVGDVAISVVYFDELSYSDDIFRRLYGRRPSEKCK